MVVEEYELYLSLDEKLDPEGLPQRRLELELVDVLARVVGPSPAAPRLEDEDEERGLVAERTLATRLARLAFLVGNAGGAREGEGSAGGRA